MYNFHPRGKDQENGVEETCEEIIASIFPQTDFLITYIIKLYSLLKTFKCLSLLSVLSIIPLA